MLKPVSPQLLKSSKVWRNTIATNTLELAKNTIQKPVNSMDTSPLGVKVGNDLAFKLMFNT